MTAPVQDAAAATLDVRFPLRGDSAPQDYADPLWRALCMAAPWLQDCPELGVHPLFGLSPGPGVNYLSRRARLTLRVDAGRVDALQALAGARLDVGGHQLELGAAEARRLIVMPVLHARCVAVAAAAAIAIGEAEFLAACEGRFAALGMAPQQMVCGRERRIAVAGGDAFISGFSLMVAGLGEADNLRLQRLGLGCERRRGCGVFVAHKSIASVATLD